MNKLLLRSVWLFGILLCCVDQLGLRPLSLSKSLILSLAGMGGVNPYAQSEIYILAMISATAFVCHEILCVPLSVRYRIQNKGKKVKRKRKPGRARTR